MSEPPPPAPPSARMAGLNAAVASFLGTGARPPATPEDPGEDVGEFSTPGARDGKSMGGLPIAFHSLIDVLFVPGGVFCG